MKPEESVAIWEAFCDQLKSAGKILQRDDLELNDFDQVEGLRYLARLTRAGLNTFTELTGPKHPLFTTQPYMVKMGLDNPDNYYVGASIKPEFDYRIRGNRGTIHYLGFAAQSQNFAKHTNENEKITGGAGHLHDAELELDADGNFEIIASQREHSGNWLRLAPDSSQVLCRQTFIDRSKEQPAVLEIECLQANEPIKHLDPRRFGGQLMGAAMYAEGTAGWFGNWVADMAEHAPPNTFYLPPAENHRAVGGDPNVRIYLGRWQLADDEALTITLTPPECDYWNFQLGNIWAESLDYRFRPVYTNSGHAKTNSDGTVTLVVSAKDPGHGNWMDTAGHSHGTMCVRWVRANEPPQPECSVTRV